MKTLLMCLLLLLVCAGAAYTQNADCARFKEGKFYHERDGIILGTITRKGDVQIERYEKYKIVCAVNWVSDCEYELRPMGGNRAWKKTKKNLDEKHVLHVKIIRTEAKGCYLEAQLVGEKPMDSEPMHIILAK
jgi:hypothetical protein